MDDTRRIISGPGMFMPANPIQAILSARSEHADSVDNKETLLNRALEKLPEAVRGFVKGIVFSEPKLALPEEKIMIAEDVSRELKAILIRACDFSAVKALNDHTRPNAALSGGASLIII